MKIPMFIEVETVSGYTKLISVLSIKQLYAFDKIVVITQNYDPEVETHTNESYSAVKDKIREALTP